MFEKWKKNTKGIATVSKHSLPAQSKRREENRTYIYILNKKDTIKNNEIWEQEGLPPETIIGKPFATEGLTTLKGASDSPYSLTRLPSDCLKNKQLQVVLN